MVVFTMNGHGFRVRCDLSLRSRERALALCHILEAFKASPDRLDVGQAPGGKVPAGGRKGVK